MPFKAFLSKAVPVTGLAVTLGILISCQEQGSQGEEASPEVEEPPPAGGSPTAPPSVLDDVVVWVDSLVLEETEDSPVAFPSLRRDPLGGWLYWDTVLDQVRRYAEDGRLIQAMGRAGDGPGEFSRVRGFMRLADGRLASLDSRGRIALWSNDGELLKDFAPELVGAVSGGDVVGNQILIYSPTFNALGPELGRWLYVVDPDAEGVTSSFFAPPLTPENATALLTVEPPLPRVFGDSIYAAVAIMDSVWSWSVGDLNGLAAVRSSGSTRVAGNSPPPVNATTPAQFREWSRQSWYLGDFNKLVDGKWLFQTWQYQEEGLRTALLLLDEGANRAWEVPSNLRLLETDESGRLYFWNPANLNPAVIQIGLLR